MLSHLNTLIGFAAIFAILSLFVTSLTQIVRTTWRMKTRSLIESLQRLFGELKDTRRFVAAILTHPSLEGTRGAAYYRILTDPEATIDAVNAAIHAVLGARPKFWKLPWCRTCDLDKQTIKDIGQTVYERIAHNVDYAVEEDGRPAKEWAKDLKKALEDADDRHLAALATPAPQPAGAANAPCPPPLHGSAVKPFRGRMWMLAAAAFPEAEGKTPPLKTYVAAFHDEAEASASDSFTWRMRIVTVVISLLLAFLLRIDAVGIWKKMAAADPARIDALQKAAQSLAPLSAAPVASGTATQAGTNDLGRIKQDLLNEIGALKTSDFDLAIDPGFNWLGDRGGEPLLGFLLAIAAMSLGAPFWFEMLKSAIQMKSAFTKTDRK